MKSSCRHKPTSSCGAALLLFLVAVPAWATPRLTVVYPNEGQVLPTIRNEFVFGHVTNLPNGAVCSLTVNDLPVAIHADGGFLAYVPVTPGKFTFEISARIFVGTVAAKGKSTKRKEIEPLFVVRNVTVTPPLLTIPRDSLAVGGDFEPPLGNVDASTRGRLDIRMRATPGCVAWATLVGVADSIPMAELPPQRLNFAGEGIFSQSTVSEGYTVEGVYAAILNISASMKCDTARLRYFVTPTASDSDGTHRSLLEFRKGRPTHLAEKSSGYAITLNSAHFPRLVRLKDSAQTLRVGPRQGYQMILQPRGTELLAVGAEGNWVELELSRSQHAWIVDTSLEDIAPGALPRQSEIGAVRMVSTDSNITIQFPLSNKHPYIINEDSRRAISIDIFGVTSNLDWIRYVSADSMVDIATWSQPEPGRFRFSLALTQDLWGYETDYIGNVLHLRINRQPRHVNSLTGKTIVLDPGHSKEPGAKGPTEFTEAQANLEISLKLRKILEARGAKVRMTRADDSDIPLYDRPAIARKYGADLFVSVHNNSCPDGVNPWENNGTATFYYHLHSLNLARAIQSRLVKATGLKDHGLYHGNLAVARATAYPAVLVECAFMIIPEQESKLKSAAFQSTVAEAIASGVEDFLKGVNHGR